MDIVVPKQQLIVKRQSDEFDELIAELAQQVRETPDLNSQNSIIRLHYFYGGSDWWITQIDLEHRLGYGFVCLNGDWQCAEYGTVSIEELCSLDVVNIDLYWTPQALLEVVKERK